ncbi:MAG: hypothetical protein WD042_08485 [Phycisphaeraceae bacterium]
MKQNLVDIDGFLHSSHGLRFGGVDSSDFLRDTEVIESMRPGVRRWIVADANALYFASHRIAEAAFLLVYLLTGRVWLSVLTSIAVITLELFRLFIFGSAMVFLPAKLSMLLRLTLMPLTVVLAVLYWNSDRGLAIFLLCFAVLQGWFSIGSSILLTAVRVCLARVFRRAFMHRYGPIFFDLRVLCLSFAMESHMRSVEHYGR